MFELFGIVLYWTVYMLATFLFKTLHSRVLLFCSYRHDALTSDSLSSDSLQAPVRARVITSWESNNSTSLDKKPRCWNYQFWCTNQRLHSLPMDMYWWLLFCRKTFSDKDKNSKIEVKCAACSKSFNESLRATSNLKLYLKVSSIFHMYFNSAKWTAL